MARTTGIQSEPLRIGIAGATGRMGREIATAAQSWAGVEIRGGLVRPGSPALDSDVAIPLFTDPVALSAVVDVVFDHAGEQAHAVEFDVAVGEAAAHPQRACP